MPSMVEFLTGIAPLCCSLGRRTGFRERCLAAVTGKGGLTDRSSLDGGRSLCGRDNLVDSVVECGFGLRFLLLGDRTEYVRRVRQVDGRKHGAHVGQWPPGGGGRVERVVEIVWRPAVLSRWRENVRPRVRRVSPCPNRSSCVSEPPECQYEGPLRRPRLRLALPVCVDAARSASFSTALAYVSTT